MFDRYCRLDFCRCLVGDLQGMLIRHVQVKSRRLSLYAIGDELNAVILCELAILFTLVCSIGIDRLHVIASNILRGIYGILDKSIVCSGGSLDLHVSDKARLAWLIRGLCYVGAVTLHLLPILSTIFSIWVMWVLKALGADLLLVSDRDDTFLRFVVLFREYTA